MTRFNPNADIVPIERWEEIGEQKALGTGASWRILGGLVAGGIGFALALEPLGIVIGGYLCYSAWEKVRKSGQNLRAVRDFGCLAHVLDPQELKSFAKQFGDGEVKQQLEFALDRGWEVPRHAIAWLNERSNQPSLPTPQRQAAPTHPLREVRQMEQNYLTNTIQQVNTQVATYNPQDGSKIDIVAEMTDRIQNIFGVGQGGSGKGMLLANACRAVRTKHPDKKIFLINGKDDPKEHGYFEGVIDVEKRLHCETAKPATVAAWFESAINDYDQFASQNNGALLIIDEGTIIGDRLAKARSTAMIDKIVGITSCGGSMGKNIWIFAQTPFAGGSGMNLTALSQMVSIVLVRGDAVGVLEQWKRSSIFRKFDSSEVQQLATESECDRAVYWGGNAKWYSMPKLTNYSAFNRDTRTYIKDIEVTNAQPTTIQDKQGEEINHKLADCILDKLLVSNGACSYGAIKEHLKRTFGNYIPKEDVLHAIAYLIQEELAEGDESSGWFFINK